MNHHRRRLTAVALAAGFALTGCARGVDLVEIDQAGPATLVPVQGSTLHEVRLTARALQRLGVRTEPLRAAGGAGRTVVPLAALVYDENGRTWVYTSSAPLDFLRHAVTVARTDGDRVLLRDGPPVGSAVVTVGAAELLGAELGVGGE